MAKKHRADKALSKVRSFSKIRFRWTMNRFESPTFLSRAVVQHAEKANAQIGTFDFSDPQAKRKKPKDPNKRSDSRTQLKIKMT